MGKAGGVRLLSAPVRVTILNPTLQRVAKAIYCRGPSTEPYRVDSDTFAQIDAELTRYRREMGLPVLVDEQGRLLILSTPIEIE
jgi:hypothetical protein